MNIWTLTCHWPPHHSISLVFQTRLRCSVMVRWSKEGRSRVRGCPLNDWGGHGASCPSLVLVGWMANVRSPMLNNALPLTFPCLVRGNCSRRCPPHMRSGATVPSSRRPQCAPRCTFNGAPMPVGTASSTPWVCSPPLFRRCLAFVPSHSSLM